MAISYVSSATGTTSVTMPTHQDGDLLIAWAYRDIVTTPPVTPPGWTILETTGANSVAGVLAYKRAASSAETSGTFTNATSLIVTVYRGDNYLVVGDSAIGTGTGTSVTYPALTMLTTDNTSWVAGYAGHASVNTSLETPPTGMINRSSVVDATDEASGHDTNGTVTSWSAQSVSVGGTASGWIAATIEIQEYRTSYYSGTGVGQSGTGSVTVAWPTHEINDIGILVIETDGNSTTLSPAGWTHFTGSPVVDVASVAGSKLNVLWKRATSNAEASVATGDSGDHQDAAIYTFKNVVINSSPIDVVTTGTKTTASTTATFPSVSTTVANELIILIGGRPDDSSSITHFSAPTNTGLAELVERAEYGTTSGTGGGFVVLTAYKPGTGAIGSTTVTKAVSTTDTYLVVAFKPEYAPTLTLDTTNGASVGSTPTILFTGTDNNGDTLTYQIQLDTVNTFDGQ